MDFTVGDLVEVRFYRDDLITVTDPYPPSDTGRGIITSIDLDYIRERDNKPLYLYEVVLTSGEVVPLRRNSLTAIVSKKEEVR
jgi:hypothetical protein